MEITDRLKEIILRETNINIEEKTRRRKVVETRALYFFVIKKLEPKITLQKIADSLELNHSTVIHSLNNYSIYEKSNAELKNHRKEILRYFKLDDEINKDMSFTERNLNAEVYRLQEENELLKETNEKLYKESNKYKEFDFKIINKLNQLMVDTIGTEKNDLIQVRLDAFYHMNKINK